MAEEAKHLETGRADRSVWLMKCPTIVSRAWQEASTASAAGGPKSNPNPGHPLPRSTQIGRAPDTDVDSQFPCLHINAFHPCAQVYAVAFKMEMSQTDNGNTPKSYSLNMFKDFVPMSVFSESNQGKLACEGKVEYKFDMEPHRENLSDYAKLCRERTKKSMIKTRKVHVLEKDNGMGMRPLLNIISLTPGLKEKNKSIPTKVSDMKRTRRDRGELEIILFKLFERQPNWSLKHLMQETDQPEQFLKEIMNDLCVYNKRGPNQGPMSSSLNTRSLPRTLVQLEVYIIHLLRCATPKLEIE